MRKITFGGANSLDNYFARTDDSVDWLMWTNEVAAMMEAYWKTIDTILLGRKTYEVGMRMNNGKPITHKGIKTYVFSRTLPKSSDKSLEIVNDDAVSFVRNLKNQPGKDICLMGGGDFACTLFEAKLIDELGFNVHPVLLGSGIPLFHKMKEQINLELIECKPLQNGCVMLSYRVKN